LNGTCSKGGGLAAIVGLQTTTERPADGNVANAVQAPQAQVIRLSVNAQRVAVIRGILRNKSAFFGF
jgi:hypothetical protein